MESGLYKKYIGSPCKKNIDPKLIVDSAKKATTNMGANLSQETKDMLRDEAYRMDPDNGEGKFFSKKHKVFVDGEDGVLSNYPTNAKDYKKV